MKPFTSSLAGIFRGPILVVGGGMDCLNDLRALGHKEYAAIISANDHAFKIPGMRPTFIVCKDNRHTETGELMYSGRLHQHGVPVISQHWWADYRLPEWKLQVNSGLMAIAVAAMLGGSPIYPVGFDFYHKGTYWHDPNAKNMSRGQKASDQRRKVLKVAEAVFGAKVVPVSGLLTTVFKQFRPGSFLSPYIEPRIVGEYRDMDAVLVRAHREFALRFDSGTTVPEGAVFWMSKSELQMPNGYENVHPVDTSSLFGI